MPSGTPDRAKSKLSWSRMGSPLGAVGPDVDHLVVALSVGDQPFLVLLLDLVDLAEGLLDEALLVRRNLHVVDADGDARARGVLVAQADAANCCSARVLTDFCISVILSFCSRRHGRVFSSRGTGGSGRRLSRKVGYSCQAGVRYRLWNMGA